jgi:putative phosphoribosyl transferase
MILFRDRRDAGDALAERLERYRGHNALVLGLPRGGVVVAAQVTRWLDAELDVVVARKLPSPISPELGIGAVTANGGRFLNEDVLAACNVSEAYIEAASARQRAEALRREADLRGQRPAPSIAGRVVILVDDGLATGATMRAAVRSVQQHRPRRLVVAVPVGAPESCAALRGEVDEVVCLHEPWDFGAVGRFYGDFSQTDDEEVRTLLAEAARGGDASALTSRASHP